MAPLILDAGALIACERGDRRFWVAFKDVHHQQGGKLFISAPVLAQVWRSPRQVAIARLLNSSEVVPFDRKMAQAAGELCAATGTVDFVDAGVAVLARDFAADVATSDSGDLRRLMTAAGALGRVLPM